MREQRMLRAVPATGELSSALDAAQDALSAGQWERARALFEAFLETDQQPQAWAGLGAAAWWLGETENAVRCQRRAYAGFMRANDYPQAFLATTNLYFVYRISLGNSAVAGGWLSRGRRLVADFQLTMFEGWVALLDAHNSDDPVRAGACARRACDLARRFGDRDLELCALSQLGATHVQRGDVHEGGEMLDEAMARALAGEGQRLETVVYAVCNMISACSQAAEVTRAAQWIRDADEFTARYGSTHLYSLCRTYYGSVLFWLGRWQEAEAQLELALRAARTAERAMYGQAVAELCELRLAQGRVGEAVLLLDGLEGHASVASVQAAVSAAQGEHTVALRVLRRRLRELESARRARIGPYRAGLATRMERAGLLERLVDVELAMGASGQAAIHAEQLREAAHGSNCTLLVARADRSLGRVALAEGAIGAGVECLEQALTAFAGIDVPFETARTRLLLAQALAESDSASATNEARAALAAFEALGAARLADETAALLRRLGAPAGRGGHAGTGALTRREREVLALLGEGCSNRELATRLFLSQKTVEHHVSNVLAKLELKSRAEAAAFAVRHGG